MNPNSICIVLFFAFCACNTQPSPKVFENTKDTHRTLQTVIQNPTDSFELRYSYAGLGSGYGSMQPVFKITGNDYVYTKEQNSSFTGKFTEHPKFVCKGKMRDPSIDSIADMVKKINDTLIYKTNPEIMSGGIHTIFIKCGTTKVTFQLHNASDPTAQKIVDILNSNIPADKQKLWLFE